MALFVVRNASESQVGLDLFTIVGADMKNLGISALPGATTDRVTYSEGAPSDGVPVPTSPVRDLVNTLVNSPPPVDPSINTVITGVPSTFMVAEPDGSMTPITAIHGVTRFPSTQVNAAGTGVNAGTGINIIYDTGACNGMGHCAFDAAGGSIAAPTDVILFHELSHAFHWTTNSVALGPPADADERQTRGDENTFRAARMPALPARSITNGAGGCGTCMAAPPGPCNNCFIATAAFGSARASEVQAFQHLRDTLLRGTHLGNALVADVLSEYYRFSPEIAADIRASAGLRGAMTALVVGPLLDFLRIVEHYVGGGWQSGDLARRALDAIRRSPTSGGQLPPASMPAELLGLLEQLVAGQAPGSSSEPGSRPLPAPEHQDDIRYLSAVDALWRGPNGYVAWALFQPLLIYWRTLRPLAMDQPDDATAGAQLRRALDDWLASVPLPRSYSYCTEAALLSDLDTLAHSVFVVPAVRRRFGARLLHDFCPRAPFNPRSAFEAAGYLAAAERPGNRADGR